MSRCCQESISCPQCGNIYEIKIWKSINIDLDPQGKTDILNASFNLYSCPDCGREIKINYNCLYHDMEQHKQVYVICSNFETELLKLNHEMAEMARDIKDIPFDEFNRLYTLRAVRNYQELREKIMIWDEGLNDRCIEFCKRSCRLAFEDNGIEPEKIYFEVSDRKYLMIAKQPDGRSFSMTLDMNLYNEYKKQLQGICLPPAAFPKYRLIDEAWTYHPYTD